MKRQRVSSDRTMAENMVLTAVSAMTIAAVVAAATLIASRREARRCPSIRVRRGSPANNVTPVAASSPRSAKSSRQTAINYQSLIRGDRSGSVTECRYHSQKGEGTTKTYFRRRNRDAAISNIDLSLGITGLMLDQGSATMRLVYRRSDRGLQFVQS